MRAWIATPSPATNTPLYERVKTGLNGVNWLTEIGTAPGKGAIFAFNVDGAHAHDIAQILDRYGIAVRAGTHCAEPLMRRFGVTSSARASFALYNTLEEADAFVDALDRAQTFFAKLLLPWTTPASTPKPPSPPRSARPSWTRMTDQLIHKLKTVFDPEIPVDIYELGLIYKVDVSDDKDVAIDMTLTAPAARWPARCRTG